jgi:hypothetical protein
MEGDANSSAPIGGISIFSLMEKASLTMVEPALEPMFVIWAQGSELQWARDAWSALEAVGLTSFISED